MSATTLYVPCDVVRVRVRIGYGAQVSPIERVVLQALDAKSEGVPVEDLLNIFKLGERVTLDLLGDLLRCGYIVVEFRKATVRLAPGIDREKLDALKAAEQFNDYTDLIVDSLVGSVLPIGDGLRRPTDYRFVVPTGAAEYANSITESQLLAVLDTAIELDNKRRQEETGAPRRPRRVLAARLDPDNLPRTIERRWLPLEVNVRLDKDIGRLRFVVVDRRLSVTERQLAADRLGHIAEDLPTTRFVQALRGTTVRRLIEPPPLSQLVDRFVKRTSEIAGTAAGTRVRRHQELAQDYHQIADALRAARDAEVVARPIIGAQAHLDLVCELISAAERQLVLACPTLHYEAFFPLYESLQAALGKGIQVVLIWGAHRDSTLPDKVRTAISSLQWRESGKVRARLISSSMPSRINAAIAVADDQRALVTGFHFLANSSIERQQLGVHIEAPGGGACQPIESLLVWARRALIHQQGQLLHVRHSDFVGTWSNHDRAETATPGPLWPESEAPAPAPVPDDDRGEAVAGQVRLWSEQWHAAAQQLSAIVESRALPQARLIENGAHRELVWDALRRPGTRLIISGNLVHPEIVDDRLTAALKERATAGTNTTVLYQKSTSAGTGRDASGLLQGISAEVPLTAERRQTNARALVTDTETVVGSFDFLGTTRQPKGLRYRERSELGIRLTGRTIADEIARSLGVGSGEVVHRPLAPQLLDTSVTVSRAAAQSLLLAVSRVPPAARPGVVADHLGRGPDRWAVLSDLDRVGAPKDVLRLVAAANLRNAPDCSTAESQQWLRWLLAERWSQRAFVEAAVLRHGIRDDAVRPRLALAVVAAARGSSAVGRAIIGAWRDDADESEKVALAVVATVELLLCEGREACLTDLVEADVPTLLALLELREPWSALVQAAASYWRDTNGPLPTQAIMAAKARTDLRRILDDAWCRLAESVDRCRNVRQGFNTTVRQLFAQEGPYGPLVDAVDGRDAVAVHAWLGADGDIDPEELFGRTEVAIVGLRNATAGDRRDSYVRRLREITRWARDLIRLHEQQSGLPSDRRMRAAKEFATSVTEVWPRLQSAPLGRPEGLLAETALRDIEFAVEWAQR